MVDGNFYVELFEVQRNSIVDGELFKSSISTDHFKYGKREKFMVKEVPIIL